MPADAGPSRPISRGIAHEGGGVLPASPARAKTTLVERLIPVLRLQGLRVSVVKHAHHRFDIDHPGKEGPFATARPAPPRWWSLPGGGWRCCANLSRRPSSACTNCWRSCTRASTGCWSKACEDSDLQKIEVWRAQADKPARYPDDDFIVAVATDSPQALPQPTAASSPGPERPGGRGPLVGQQPGALEYHAEVFGMTQPRPSLRPLDEALAELLGHARPLADVDTVSTFDGDGRVLAQDLVSALQVPPQDNSSMDG